MGYAKESSPRYAASITAPLFAKQEQNPINHFLNKVKAMDETPE
jgi:hypothetical protein